jgi:inosose dehydratase
MNPHKILSRRAALKTAAFGALSLPFLATLAPAADEKAKKGKGGKAAEEPVVPEPANPSSPDGRENGLRLGMASYSTKNLTLDESIAVAKTLRLRNIALFRLHCNWEGATVDECKAVGEKLKAAGLNLTGSGVVNLPNDEGKCRKAFENVRAAGMQTMVCKPAKDAFPVVEKLAKEFDQKLAIHNHGPEDKDYPTPDVIWNAVRSLDKRIGLCIDVGHTARAGADAIAALKQFAPRLYDVHLKDSVAIVGAQKDVPIEVGAGRLDVTGMLRALLEIKYDGVVSFEYEKVAGNPVTGLAESVGYVRGVLKALAAKTK